MPRKRRKERGPEKKDLMKKPLVYYQPKSVAKVQEMLKDLLKYTLQGRGELCAEGDDTDAVEMAIRYKVPGNPLTGHDS